MLSRIPSRSSFASQASTVTLKSTSGGMRRNRIRSSVTSTRSSASDRTITNEFLNLSDDLSPDGGAGVGARDNERVEYSTSRPEDQSRNPTRHKTFNRHEQNFVLNATTDNSRRDQNTALNTVRNATTDNGKAAAMLDPTYVAQKVLAETRPQRQALEFMQKWSVDKLQQKRMECAQNDRCGSDDTPSESNECHPSLRGQSLHELTDSASDLSLHGGSSCAVSQPSKSVGQSTETKKVSGPEMVKSEVTYANVPFSKHPGDIPPGSRFVQPDRRHSFNQVGSGEGDTVGQTSVSGQNAAFRGSNVATSEDKLQSSGSTPWRNTPSTTAGGQTAFKRLFGCNTTTKTGSGKSADSNFSQASPAVVPKPFMESSSMNVALSSGAPQTRAEELCLSDDLNDSAVNRNTTKQVLSPNGQAHPHDNNGSVDVKCASAMKDVRRPSKPKTVKFQDEIETMSLSSDEPSPKAESCVVKNTGSGSASNVVRDNGAQLGDRSVGEIGKTPEDSPVMYKHPPPYPGPGRQPPSSYMAAQFGTIEGGHPTGNATLVSNGYRECETLHDQYNDHASVRNGHSDRSYSPVRRGGSTDSSTTPVDDEMGDLNSRQNLKRMSMHMYTSSDDSTTSAGHRPNGVAHKRVTENFQRFQQARTCNGDAMPNTNTNFATSTPSFTSVQNGAPKFTANHPDAIRGPDRRREHDWERRTIVPGEHTFDRSRHIRDPSTLPSSQC